MFKKFSNSFENQETTRSSPLYENLEERPCYPFSTDYMNALPPRAVDEESVDEEPETVIASGVAIVGKITFQKLLRIDGSFEGELVSNGKLIVGPTGSVTANLDLEEAFISGKVTGDIRVKKRLVLRGRAEVRGDVTTPLLSVDEGVSINGSLNVTQEISE